ncbi:MAG: DUF4258 domain-containing protein [Anaerolineae bacterium]
MPNTSDLTNDIIFTLKKLVRAGQYRLTLHAEFERDADQITLEEIDHALLSEQCEVIEDYPYNARGHSCLMLGFTNQGDPIHFVCGLSDPEMLVIITVYRPGPERWIDWRIKRQ